MSYWGWRTLTGVGASERATHTPPSFADPTVCRQNNDKTRYPSRHRVQQTMEVTEQCRERTLQNMADGRKIEHKLIVLYFSQKLHNRA